MIYQEARADSIANSRLGAQGGSLWATLPEKAWGWLYNSDGPCWQSGNMPIQRVYEATIGQ